MEDGETERALLFGLLVECPLMRCDDCCPVEAERRRMTVQEKITYVEGLSDDQVRGILDHHRACLTRREGRETT